LDISPARLAFSMHHPPYENQRRSYLSRRRAVFHTIWNPGIVIIDDGLRTEKNFNKKIIIIINLIVPQSMSKKCENGSPFLFVFVARAVE